MSRNTETEWFGMDVKPAIPGVYRLRDKSYPYGSSTYSHWNGEYWGLAVMLPDYAERYADKKSKAVLNGSFDAWCGVVEKPEWA